MRFSHLTPFIAAASLLVSGAVHAATDAFEFDPDGAGPDAPIIVNSFDWLPGSTLSVGSVPLPVAPTFAASHALSHAKLGNFINSSGQPILGTGLNSAYEITTVSSIPEMGTSSGTTGIFSFDSNGSPNFFELYWDPAKEP